MEKPMQELWGSVMQKTTSVQDAEAIKPLIEEMTQLYEEQLNLQNSLQVCQLKPIYPVKQTWLTGLANELSLRHGSRQAPKRNQHD